jgi:hypothetical protein
MNLFDRFLSYFRRHKPAMIGTPPSARQIPADPGLHAVDFSLRYAVPMNYHVENRMMELGIPTHQIGSSVPVHGIRHAAFIPQETTGGGNGPGGRLIVDSGVFNPDLHADLGPEVSSYWAKSRLRDRMDAIIAHEHAEVYGATHLEAEAVAADTELPIREDARKLLRVIAGRESPGRKG